MEIEGVVQNGVIVPRGKCPLPEGTKVIITPSSIGRAAGRWDDLLQLVDEVESEPCDLPTDLAANHDHYISGAPKRP
jgi:predicted DNA-binding antitoxin AbrB/MazE fold protein